jgi:hypothetical protein
VIRYPHYRDHNHWYPRYGRWYEHSYQPPVIIIRIVFPNPMPDYGPGQYWTLRDVEVVALNLENLSQRIYSTMAPIAETTGNREYGERLLDRLAYMDDAAEAFTDAVDAGYDFSDSLNELFYLEDEVIKLEQTLSGFSQSYRVQEEMRSMRHYVNLLLWVYRQNY